MVDSLPIQISPDHPAYAGHFPGQPILPGVVLLDAMIHALSVQHRLNPDRIQIKSAKFLSPVTPGEAITLSYEETATGNFRFELMANGRRAASGVVSFSSPGTGT